MSDNYHLNSAERVAALVNDSSGSQYQLGVHFNLGIIESVTREDGRNTRAQILYVGTKHGPIDVFYKRQPAGHLGWMIDNSGPGGFVPPERAFSTSEIMALVNEQIGLDIRPYEYVDEIHDEGSEFITIHLTANSPAWLPGAFTITLVSQFARMTEDGRYRVTENGQYRITESMN